MSLSDGSALEKESCLCSSPAVRSNFDCPVHGSIQRFNQVLEEASARYNLKELVWKIYQNPKLVEKASAALKIILEREEA